MPRLRQARTMTLKTAFSLKSSIINRERILTLDPAYLEYDDNDHISSPPTKFEKEDVEGIRYGIKWLLGRYFYFGRVYCIDIRSDKNKVIKIRLHSLYGVKKKELGKKYAEIVNMLFKYYFHDISRSYLTLFKNNIPFELLGVMFSADGILFDQRIGTIPWEYVGTKSYYTYYAIFSEINPGQYRSFEYINDWNAGVFKGV